MGGLRGCLVGTHQIKRLVSPNMLSFGNCLWLLCFQRFVAFLHAVPQRRLDSQGGHRAMGATICRWFRNHPDNCAGCMLQRVLIWLYHVFVLSCLSYSSFSLFVFFGGGAGFCVYPTHIDVYSVPYTRYAPPPPHCSVMTCPPHTLLHLHSHTHTQARGGHCFDGQHHASQSIAVCSRRLAHSGAPARELEHAYTRGLQDAVGMQDCT